MANGEDIIIRGGSVEIEFDEQTFPGKGGKYGNKDKNNCQRGDQGPQHESNAAVNIPVDGKCTIRITTK